MALEIFIFFSQSLLPLVAPHSRVAGKRQSAESSVAGQAEGRYFAGKLGRFRQV